jgi:hypothetical protein
MVARLVRPGKGAPDQVRARVVAARASLATGGAAPGSVGALARCSNMLDDIVGQVVIVGGVRTRESGYGLYELMHAVTDSFSYAHTEREPGTHHVDFLRVCASGGPSGRSR